MYESGIALAGFNPIVQKVLSQMILPKFGGKPEDWPAFKKLWSKSLEMINLSSQGQALPDRFLLEMLRGALDAPNRKFLQKREELYPDLTYAGFWAELEGEFEIDLKYRHRAAWQQVK